ncbi:MAG: AAA family ATPase [Thermoanaerobaculia bacterium]|jgi:Holliday junction DNA helicase RuvB
MRKPFTDGAGFHGQKRLVTYVRDLYVASKQTVRAAPPILLVGPPGGGKSTIAAAIANLTEAELIRLDADSRTTPLMICERLLNAPFGTIVFVDEAHALNREAQELLQCLIDDHQMPRIAESGRLDRFERVNVAPLNLVLATTCPGQIFPALFSRLEVCELDPYSHEELKEIARDSAAEEGVRLTAQAARVIAERCQGSPRIARRLVSLLVLTNDGALELTQSHAEELLARRGISRHGLTPSQQQYLRHLAAAPAGRSSFERLGAEMRLDGNFVRREIEPYLIHLRAIVIETSRSRLITDAGKAIVNELREVNP